MEYLTEQSLMLLLTNNNEVIREQNPKVPVLNEGDATIALMDPIILQAIFVGIAVGCNIGAPHNQAIAASIGETLMQYDPTLKMN
jgi:hypothetical protein